MTATTTIATEPKSEVLNIRVTASVKSRLVAEAIRDSRSLSRIAERALEIGLAQIEASNAPAPAPAPASPKAKRKKK